MFSSMRIRAAVAACLLAVSPAIVSLHADALPRATPESVGMSSRRLARIAATLRRTSTTAASPAG
jgi:hypothetical protein